MRCMTKNDLQMMLSAINALEEEGYNEIFMKPKRNFAIEIAIELNNDVFDSLRTPKWLKKGRNHNTN